MGDLGLAAKLLVLTGIVLIGMGGLIWLVGKITGGSGALLPGDIVFRREGFTFHFPIVTCLVLSAIATLILCLVSALRR